jgi:Mn-dependent DtxR family transcriptional regulator
VYVPESQENYLERILMLQQEKGYARSVDIAQAMGVTKPSVSHAMKQLREGGYITMAEDNLITLTESGSQVAERMLERHMTIARFLMTLGISERVAYEDACKMEHDLSDESFLAICGFIEDGCPLHMKNAQQKKQEPPRPVQESIDPALL